MIEKEVHQQNLAVYYYVKMWSIVMIHDFSRVWSRISDYYQHHFTTNRFKYVICKRVREELVHTEVNAFQMNWIICNWNEYRGKVANKITAFIVPIADTYNNFVAFKFAKLKITAIRKWQIRCKVCEKKNNKTFTNYYFFFLSFKTVLILEVMKRISKKRRRREKKFKTIARNSIHALVHYRFYYYNKYEPYVPIVFRIHNPQ